MFRRRVLKPELILIEEVNMIGAPLLQPWESGMKSEQVTSGDLQAVDHGMSCTGSGNRIDRRKKTVEFANRVRGSALLSRTPAMY
jgi:hypothetical protein